MSSKGGQTTLKRIAAGKATRLARKELTWTIKPSPGAHSEKTAVALGFVLRDLLGIANNLKEAKIILSAGKVKVNSIVRKEYKFPVGLFDVVQTEETKKAFRMLLDKHGRLFAREVKPSAKMQKVCKIAVKKMLRKSTLQLVASDGKTFVVSEKDAVAKAKPDDSILVELPGKILQVLELKKGNTVFVIGGKHVSDIAKVVSVSPSTMQRAKLITLDSENGQYSTVAENVFVIGEAKSAIEL